MIGVFPFFTVASAWHGGLILAAKTNFDAALEFLHIRARWVRLRGTKLGWTIYWREGSDFEGDLHPSASIVELCSRFRFLYVLSAPWRSYPCRIHG